MNKQDNLELNNAQSVTEDLTVNEDQAKEVKGSGGFGNVLRVSVVDTV